MTKDTDAMRRDFETWLRLRLDEERYTLARDEDAPDKYHFTSTQALWETWQAAMQSRENYTP